MSFIFQINRYSIHIVKEMDIDVDEIWQKLKQNTQTKKTVKLKSTIYKSSSVETKALLQDKIESTNKKRYHKTTIQRDINCLHSENQHIRLEGLEGLIFKFSNFNNDTKNELKTFITQNKDFTKLIISLLSDLTEKCRSNSIKLLSLILPHISLENIIEKVILKITDRIGNIPVKEPYEELRLMLLNLLLNQILFRSDFDTNSINILNFNNKVQI